MNVLDRLTLDVPWCGDFAGNRPYDVAAKLRPYALLFNPGDPVVFSSPPDKDGVPAIVGETEHAGYAFGLRFNSDVHGDPTTWANDCSKVVKHFGDAARVTVVMHDVELDKAVAAAARLAWQAAFLDRWDAIRYGRPTIYNVAELQDTSQNDYARMLRRNRQTGQRLRKIAVQPYHDVTGGPTMVPDDVRRVVDAQVAVVESLGGSRDDVMPNVDPANALHYLAALDCETRGAVIFEAGRIPL